MSAAPRSAPRLRALPPAGHAPAPRAPRKPRTAYTIVQQVRIAFRPRNRLATLVGLILGGFVPAATYTVAHAGPIELRSLPAALVAGGLLYSAPTVWAWVKTFAGPVKALGFVLLVEGIMVASPIRALALAAVGLLVAINAIATGCSLSRGRVS